MAQALDRRWTRGALLGAVGLAPGLALVAVWLWGSPKLAGAVALLAVGIVLLILIASAVALSDRSPRALLTVLVVVLFLIPENYVLAGPLKSVGNPGLMLGLGCMALWIYGRVHSDLNPRVNHPGRWAVLVFTLASTSALVAAFMRPLLPVEEAGADRAIFPVLAFIGIAMLATDGLRGRDEVDRLLQVLVVVGGIAALIGIIEFFSPGWTWYATAKLPGLTSNTFVVEDVRSGFSRVDGAAAHPIEYVVALAAIGPLALHYATRGATKAIRQRSAASLVAILVVIPMTVSRSGVLAVAVGFLVLLATMSHRAKLNAFALGLIGVGAMRAAIPGLIGTIRSLILVGQADPSIQGRTEDYTHIPYLLDGHWFLGRGLGTFQPQAYFFLDNQFLGSLIEGGWVGLVGLITVFVTGIGLARGWRKVAPDQAGRQLGQAIAASVAALAASAATFDELSFHQTGFMVFLLLGCAGALWAHGRSPAAREAQVDAASNSPSLQAAGR